VCADDEEKSAVALFVYQRAFSQNQRCAMVGETVRKASAVNCVGLPLNAKPDSLLRLPGFVV
jgi:hypothetical protein